jgi:serine/threonine protein kinase
MTGEPDTWSDEYCASLLAACEEALAAGEPTAMLTDAVVQPELRRRLERGMASARLLRQVLSRKRMPPDDRAGLPWTKLGRFEIRRELGRGGFAFVYLAYDPQLQREVALKVPRPELIVTGELRARFLREARAAAILDHPNLVPVHEAGEVGPVCYLVSSYYPGQTLAAWLRGREGPVPGRAAAELVAVLAEAVQHAHSRGVLHRDLKPANILLTIDSRGQTADGRQPKADTNADADLLSAIPKITDFGLAKFLEGDLEPTRTGAVLGTPAYMAPEQASGHSRRVGREADVYALGVILYELLTGRPPFQSESILETLEQVRTREPVRPSRRSPHLPRDLETICLRCLAKEPAKRYPSASALADDLGRFLNNRPILARRTGPIERTWRWCRRNPAVAGLLVTVATLLLSLAIANRLSAYRLYRQTREADEEAERDRLTESERKRELDALLDRAANYASHRAWKTSLGYLNQAAESRPDSALAFTSRGRFYARFYLWDLAAADFGAAFALQPSGDPHLWLRHAALSLYQGDDRGYQETCRRMLERFGSSPNADDQEQLTLVCGLGPTGLDQGRLLRLGEQCLVLPVNDRFRYFLSGTLFYRAGQFDRAIPLLRKSLDDDVDALNDWLNSHSWPVLAMACLKAGRADEGRLWLEKTNQRVEQMTNNLPVEPLEDDLALPPDVQWLCACLLRREAQGLLGDLPTADLVLHQMVQSRGLAKLDRWDEAQAAFTKVIELRPTQGRFRLDRAHFFARRSQWELAAADFDDACRLGARDRLFDWYCHALCRLRMEDDEGYRRIREEVLRRFGGRPKPRTVLEVVELHQVASICFLRPIGGANLELATRLARTALAADPDNPLLLLGSSAAYIRGGAPEKAIPVIHNALGKRWKMHLDWGGPVLAWLQLSVAHHRLGQVEEGRAWFNKAVQRIDGEPDRRESETTGIRWHLGALFEIMRREAAGLYGA